MTSGHLCYKEDSTALRAKQKERHLSPKKKGGDQAHLFFVGVFEVASLELLEAMLK